MSLDVQIQHRDKGLISSAEDDEIVNRIVAGEKNLYALIIRKYNQRLYRIALSIIDNNSEIPDIMQTAYIKAYEHLSQFKFQSSFATWLTKILINESLACLRKKEQTRSKEKNRLSLETRPGTTDKQTPLMNMLNTELKTILEDSIRKLPNKYGTVFIMREIENMSIAETMECLGLTEANVKVRLNRAKVMLRNKLGNYFKDDEMLKLYKPVCNRIVEQVMGEIIQEQTPATTDTNT
jgi:RNA polymerase sigma factor (sigma-70 family)